MIRRIVNNFFLRNLVVLSLFISPDLLQDLANAQTRNWPHMVKHIAGLAAFYLYFVFHSRILYEKLFLNKKYFLYAATLLLTLFAWRESSSYLIWLITRPPSEHVYYITELKDYNAMFWVFIYWADVVYTGIALAVYLAFKYFRERQALLEMDNVRKELELKQLNEQLNPHFLFNSLNNIYSHILRGSDDGKELVLKLSELMRYILDSSKKRVVPLCDEIQFIEHYIAFEKERLGERCMVRYTKDIQPDFNIVSLVLFNFIENAFKHGTTSLRKAEITIDIKADTERLLLTVANSIFNNNSLSTRTGMNNVQRRLSLLYPGANSLDIRQDEHTYTVKLELKNIA